MKKKFLQNSLNLIEKYNPDLDEIKLDEIRYGLEVCYINVTKMIIIFITAFALGIIRESLFVFVIFNIIRKSAGGFHASKSIECLLVSLLILVIFPYIFRYIVFSYEVKIIIGLSMLILIILYAPADTIKAPIINIKSRRKYKIYSIIITIILIIISVNFSGQFSTLIILSLLFAIITILPITYKIFGLPYANYKNYCVK